MSPRPVEVEIEVGGLGQVIFVPEGVSWEEYQDWLIALESDPDTVPFWEEEKAAKAATTRRVRTREGAERFDQAIGTIIVPDLPGSLPPADATRTTVHEADPDRTLRLRTLYADGLPDMGMTHRGGAGIGSEVLFIEENRAYAKREIAEAIYDRLDVGMKKELARLMAEDRFRLVTSMAQRANPPIPDISKVPTDPMDPRVIWRRYDFEGGGDITPDPWENFAAWFPDDEGPWSSHRLPESATHQGAKHSKDGYTAERWRGGERELTEELARDYLRQFIANWADTSNDNNPTALAIQEAIREEFGLGHVMEWETPFEKEPVPEDPRTFFSQEAYEHAVEMAELTRTNWLRQMEKERALIPLYRKLVRLQYENTQQWFKDHGVDELLIYRGMKWGQERPPNWWYDAKNLPFPEESMEVDGETMTEKVWPTMAMPELRPASSWAWGSQVARNFAGLEMSAKDLAIMQALGQEDPMEQPKAVLATVVPVEAILATPRTGFGCLPEQEILLLATGGTTRVLVAGTVEEGQ